MFQKPMVLLVALAIAGCGGYGGTQQTKITVKPRSAIQHLTLPIVNTAFVVEPRAYKSFELQVAPGTSGARVEGTFSASGARNDIEVTLLEKSQFLNFQNHSTFKAAYESGRVTAGHIHVDLPAEPGTYYVVFSNTFSILSNKAVTADVKLEYDRPQQ